MHELQKFCEELTSLKGIRILVHFKVVTLYILLHLFLLQLIFHSPFYNEYTKVYRKAY